MSGNVEKYENWRAITESDYVAMFIKTWFAFVATLRELYPKENLEDIIGRGDSAFLNPFLDDFQNRYFSYNKLNSIKDNVLKVYKLGRRFTLESKKYNRFFSEDFYAVNKSYSWKQTTSDYELSIKYSRDTEIVVHAKYLDKSLYLDGTPLILTAKVDISDLVSSEHLTSTQIANFIEDEAAFAEYVSMEITERASLGFISQITNGNYTSKFKPKVLAYLNSTTLSMNAELIKAFSSIKDPSINKEEMLFTQLPCANFIYKVEDGDTVPEEDTYKWFLKFVYFMRNALFHEIIDPLDTFWQEIFKHSYLALKEILDGNINYFLEKKKVLDILQSRIWQELSEKQDTYIPNFNSDYYNGDLAVVMTSYSVDDHFIMLNANVSLDYWYDAHSMKKMDAVSKATIERSTMNVSKFKMELKGLTDVPERE